MSKETLGFAFGKFSLGLILVFSIPILTIAACGSSTEGIQTTRSLEATHSVALKKVVLMPDAKEIAAGYTYDLTPAGTLTFLVSLENQGSVNESQVRVTVTLVSASTPLQSISRVAAQMPAGTAVEVQVPGLEPTKYGEPATLTVQVGPVPGETNLRDNSLTATVVFKL